MIGFEENEISVNANGGTELAKRGLAKLLDKELLSNFQIIPSRIRDLEDDKIRILWLHDLPEDPMFEQLKDPNFRNKFHKFVFVSQWQYQRFLLITGMPYDHRCIVLETGFDPIDVDWSKKDGDEIRLVYNTTPHRGLEILVPVFEFLAERHDNIHLDVFSSYKIYGWDNADQQYNELFERCKNHPKITYHGYQPNDVVLQRLTECHIHAYPSIWLETSCRSLIEAMSAGLVCVHPNFGALPDTSGGLNLMYQGEEEKANHANIFVNMLNGAINLVKEKKHHNLVTYNKFYADQRFNIRRVAGQWNNMLELLVQQYPDAESRKIPKDMLIYKTS